MKQLFADNKGRIDDFISVDGLGASITNIGVGSYPYKVTFSGPGGHSYGSFNVGRAGGGTSVNAIPFDAWMEVDMRSADVKSLEALHTKFKQSVEESVAEENTRWHNQGPVSASSELVGLRPAGATPERSPIVQTAIAG